MAESRLIVFDWDGTLMDSTGRIIESAKASIEELGLPARDDTQIRDIIGLAFPQVWERLYPDLGQERFREFVASYRRFFCSEKMRVSELYPGARDLLDELHDARHVLAIATGKGRKGLESDLQATGLEDYFRLRCTAEDTRPKPQPDMLLHLLAVSGIDARHSLMIGDTEYDLEMACCAGVARVGIGHGAHSPDRFGRWDPLTTVGDLVELRRWLSAYLSQPEFREA